MSAERCDNSDLPINQCACPIHTKPTALPDPRPVVVATRFHARFDSACDACGADMYEGDWIGRTSDGEYVCEVCAGPPPQGGDPFA